MLLGRYKLIRDLSTGAIEMFDVVADPDEETDVSKKLPTERAALAQLLEGWERDMAVHTTCIPTARRSRRRPPGRCP